MSSIRQSAAREDSDSDEDEGGDDERTLFKDANSDAVLAQNARGMYYC